MKKIMISQPMKDKSDLEIQETRKHAILELEKKYGDDFKFINTSFSEECDDESLQKAGVVKPGVYFLGRTITQMSLCDAVYFCSGWENYRGCSIEHSIAEKYGIDIIYE